MTDSSYSLIFAADATTAVAGAFNATWLAAYWLRLQARGRRIAALSLALVSAGIAVQAAFAQALFSAHRLGWSADAFSGATPWLAARLPLLAGTLLLSMLILRRAA
jgi:hypothetical protein